MPAASAVHVIDHPERAATALHPLRLRILAELDEPASAAGLARRLGLPRQQLNYHLRLLERDGLVEPAGERKRRNCTERLMRAVARSYVIDPATLGEVAADPARSGDQLSSSYLVAAAARVITEVATLQQRARAGAKRLPTLTLQADVRFASPEAQHAFAEELSEILARLVAKYHDAAALRGRPFRLLAAAYPSPDPIVVSPLEAS
ncbi:MAG TPA: helix-turn-helix domain-containing protein [Gemmatimonadales bacterium]|nr:helix-turn-helix domain-containing protein [Gemmatimonadales bacterium]